MKKFELTGESINHFGRTLFRIRALVAFRCVEVGELGGYLEKEKNLSQEDDAWVFGDAQVFGNARVYDNVWEKSPLQIQGTKHFVCMCTRKLLNIGCTRLTIDEWKKKGIILGEQNGYTTEQIEEYRLYIELAAKLYPPIEEEKDL